PHNHHHHPQFFTFTRHHHHHHKTTTHYFSPPSFALSAPCILFSLSLACLSSLSLLGRNRNVVAFYTAASASEEEGRRKECEGVDWPLPGQEEGDRPWSRDERIEGEGGYWRRRGQRQKKKKRS